jgi:hypothetical protein
MAVNLVWLAQNFSPLKEKSGHFIKFRYPHSMQIVISSHSFVDLITNSSSELFVCNTEKSVKAVKKIIEELAKLYNKKMKLAEKDVRGINKDTLWTDVFSEPTIAMGEFDLSKFNRFKEWQVLFNRGNYYNQSEHPVKRDADEDMQDWERKNPAPTYTNNETNYQNWLQENRKAADKIYFQYNNIVLDIYKEMYAWVAEVNSIDFSRLGPLVVNSGRYSDVYFDKMRGKDYQKMEKNKTAMFVKEIEAAILYDYSFKKGDIFLSSASDNTIPYDFWPDIENIFNCQRRHIG